jgi:hypothetical protein
MIRRVRAGTLGAGVLLAVLISGVSPHPATNGSATPLLHAPTGGPQPDVVLPSGFVLTVDRATRDQFVRIAAGDVDRDGDIDVVASLGSLDLIVWRNDGAGHFTRVPSSHHSALRTQPPAPSVDGQSLASLEWIQNSQPRGADLESLRARASKGPARPFTSIVHIATGRYGPRVRSSRAPPIA